MDDINVTISNNILKLLKKNGKKQNDLAKALDVSKQVMSNMLNGNRMINAVELRKIADFFHVSMEDLMDSPTIVQNKDAIHVFMGEVNSPEAKHSLEIADKIADMIIYYARVRENAEEMNKAWEA